jgi:hypothetical protein
MMNLQQFDVPSCDWSGAALKIQDEIHQKLRKECNA